MTDVLLIYLKNQSYTQETGTEYHFDTTIIGDLLGADKGYAVTTDDEPIQFHGFDKREQEVFEQDYYVQTSTVYNRHFCVSDEDLFTTEVELFSGERVDVGSYDVVLISHFWMHHYYLRYLLDEYTETTFIGIQEESVQDILGSSSRLQMQHFRTLIELDGLIAFNEQYRRWSEPHRPNVMHMPLPVPPGQYDDYDPASERRDAACVGLGTWNLDHSNFYSNVRVLERLRANGHKLDGEIVGIRDWQQGTTVGFAEGLNHMTVRGFMYEELYDHLSEFKLAIILTSRATAGRMAADFAGLGVPCIGNGHNYFQSRLWPELSVDSFDVPSAIAIAERLLSDQSFYKETIRRAERELKALQNLDRFEERLANYVATVYDS